MTGTDHRLRVARRHRWLIGALAVACVVQIAIALVGENGLIAVRESRRTVQAAQAELQANRRQNAILRDQIRRLKEDPATIEEIARRELGMAKQGEVLFIIRDVPSKR